MIWVWLIAFVIAVIVEALTQDLVSIWFAVGALITLIISNWVPMWAEFIVFSVISFMTLFLTRPLAKKLTQRAVRYTNVDEFVGRRVKTEKEISKFNAGEIKVNGIIYSAVLLENEEKTIPVGATVEIVSLKGNKIVVKEIEE